MTPPGKDLSPQAQVSRIEQIKARAEKATKGPWGFDLNQFIAPAEDGDEREWGLTILMLPMHVSHYRSDLQAQARDDAEFAAEARIDIPWLLERNAELLEALKGAKEIMLNMGWPVSQLGRNREVYEMVKAAIAEMEKP